jgi:hypothetical protein
MGEDEEKGNCDDAVITAMVLKACHDDLKAYKEWEVAQEVQDGD